MIDIQNSSAGPSAIFLDNLDISLSMLGILAAFIVILFNFRDSEAFLTDLSFCIVFSVGLTKQFLSFLPFRHALLFSVFLILFRQRDANDLVSVYLFIGSISSLPLTVYLLLCFLPFGFL